MCLIAITQMNQNEPPAGLKLQMHQIWGVWGLIRFLAAASCTISDMAQAHNTRWMEPFKQGFQKLLIWSALRGFALFLWKHMKRERNTNAKRINMEMIRWVILSMCVWVSVHEVYMNECVRLEPCSSVFCLEQGHCDYHRGAVFWSPQSQMLTLF